MPTLSGSAQSRVALANADEAGQSTIAGGFCRPVPTPATLIVSQELMVDYYNRLLSGTSRDAALRETQLGFLNSEKHSHPYYWAAFIGSGNWRPLDE